MNKHHILIFLGAAAVAFFLRATLSAWPVFSTVYGLTNNMASAPTASTTS